MTANTMTTKDQLGAVLGAQGTHTLGALVFWSLAGVRIRRDEFREELEKLGLEAAMPGDPSPKGALGKAVQKTMVGRGGVLARRSGKDWAIVEETRVGGAGEESRLKHLHVLTVTADANAGVRWHTPTADAKARLEQSPATFALVTAALDAHYSEARDYLDTADMSEILSSAMTGSPHRGLFAAVSLRERTGGLYFLHGQHVDRMASLAELINRLAPACVVNCMSVTGDGSNMAQASAAAKQSFATQLAELRQELVQFRAKLREDGKAPSSYSIKVRAERFADLKARVDLFRSVLGDVASELEGQIEDGKAQMVKALEELQ